MRRDPAIIGHQVFSCIIFLTALVRPTESTAQLGILYKRLDAINLSIGPTLASARGLKYEEYNARKIAYNAGLSGEWFLSEKISVTAGIIFERKGFNRDYPRVQYTDSLGEIHIGHITDIKHLDYLTVDITPKYYLDSRKRVFISAGGYVALLLKVQTIQRTSWDAGYITSDKDDYRPGDAGFSFSTGFSQRIGSGYRITYAAFLRYGLVDISLEPPNGAIAVAKNTVVGINVGLEFLKNSFSNRR